MKYQIVSERTAKYEVKVKSPSDVYPALTRYAKKKKEHFFVLTLNGAHELIKVNIITIGLLNRTIIHPREVFKAAIVDDSAAIILAHNHPSGNLDPSSEDRAITERLAKAGDILGIRVLDHVIFSTKGYYSFMENESERLNT